MRKHRQPPAADAKEARRWITKDRVQVTRDRNTALRIENAQLRRALRQVVGWYDTFDRVPEEGGWEPELTEDDFERFRKLARAPLRVVLVAPHRDGK